jgi:hypothetical protein
MVSLLTLTFVTFIYNAFYQLMPHNFLLVSSVVSWVIGIVIMIPMNKKDVYYFEYSIFFIGLSLCLYALRGIFFIPKATYAFYGTLTYIAAYWIYTIVVHCFALPGKLYSKTLVNTICIVLAVVLPLVMVYVYMTNSSIVGYKIWM